MVNRYIRLALTTGASLCLVTRSGQSQGTQQQGSAAAAGRLDPSSSSAAAKAEFWAGLDDWQNFEFTPAIERFRKAAVLDPGFGLARVFGAGVSPITIGEYRAGDMDRGVADAARASTLEGLYALAWREKTANNVQRATQLFRAAMDMAPNEPRVVLEYVWELSFFAPKVALDAAKVLRGRFPDYAPVYAALSIFSLNAGDTAASLAAAQEYMHRMPKRATAVDLYAGVLQFAGRFGEAEAEYQRQRRLEAIRPGFGSEAASSLVQLYLVMGRADDARAVAEQELARVSNASDSANYLAAAGASALFAGNATRGLQLIEAARQKARFVGDRSAVIPVDLLLANAHALFGDKRLVTTYLQRLPVIAPTDTVLNIRWLGTTYARAGELDSALKYVARYLAVSNSPSSADMQWAHLARGVAYKNVKQCGRATDELRQADPGDLEAQAAIADCALQQGDRATALRSRDRVLAPRSFNLFSLGDLDAVRRMAAMK